MLNAFSDLEKLVTPSEPEPVPANKPEAPEEPAEHPEDAKSAEEPAEKKAPEPPAGKQPSKVASLRQAYEQAKTKLTQLELELKALREAKPPEDPEKKTLAERLAEREKRLQDLEERLRFSAYEQSDEYKERYEKPFIDAYQAGRAGTAELEITLEDGTTRQATAADFDKVMMAPTNKEAFRIASELFADQKDIVLFLRQDVIKANMARAKALEEYRKNGGERHRQQVEQQTQAQQQAAKMFEELNKQAVEKFPQLFKPMDGDDEGNRLLEKGFRKVDMAFNNGRGVDENGKDVQLDSKALIALHSVVRNKAAAFDRQVYLNKKLMSKVTELEGALKKYKESEPGPGEGGKIKEKPRFSTLMDEAEAGLEKFIGK